MEKLKRFSFALATIFIVAALGIKVARPEWEQYANYSIGGGIFFFLLSLYLERRELKNFFGARATRFGLNSFLIIILMLAILSTVNWIVQRHAFKWDTTKNQQFSLSPLTINTLKDLKQPVKVTAFFSESPLPSEPDAPERRLRMVDLLDNYRVHTRQLDIKIVDPLKNRLMLEQYGVSTNGTTILESGNQKATVSTIEEEDLTNAILRVTSNKEINVYFLQEHGEPSINDSEGNGFSALIDQLRKSNYNIKELKDLAVKAAIPEDCSVLVVSGTKVPLQEHEIKAIRDYLALGGRALVLDDPQTDASVAKVFSDYKVNADNNFVIDDRSFFFLADPTVPEIIPSKGTPVTKEFNFRLFFPLARSLTYEQGEADITITPFAESSPTSWGETDKQVAQFDEGKDTRGPLTVGLLLTKKVTGEKKRSEETRLAIFGDLNFIQNAFVGFGAHREIVQNCISWLTEQENLIHLPPRDAKSDVLTIGAGQVNLLGVLFILVLPLVVLGTGIAVWMRRKRL